jgi:CheY-like chemotaxis protein
MNIQQQDKKHILFADDDSMTRRLFGSKLAFAGFEVLYATNGNDLIEMAIRFQPDLVVTDIDMPNTDGITAAYKLRENPQTKNINIIFLTNADISMETEKVMKELVGASYMSKSIELSEFIEQVQRIINQ